MINWIGIILLVAGVVLIVLPPKYDPAIRLKKWFEGRHHE